MTPALEGSGVFAITTALTLVLALVRADSPKDAPKDAPVRVTPQQLADDFSRDVRGAMQKYRCGVIVTGRATREFKRSVRVDARGPIEVWIDLGRFRENPKWRVGKDITATGRINPTGLVTGHTNELHVSAESIEPKGP
jgi:hypothetical protein